MNPMDANATKLEKFPRLGKDNIAAFQGTLRARGRSIEFPRRPLAMGILNINDDSFSGDGSLDQTWALKRAAEMVSQGADIIDVGGESARTNRPPVTETEETNRILPFLEKFSAAVENAKPRDPAQLFPPLLSLNTWRPAVASAAAEIGFDILNDIGALPDDTNARICARTGAALLIMHSQGSPKIPHTHATYPDILAELEAFFREKTSLALAAGLPREQIILDPGIDFAKQAPDNLAIFRHLDRIAALGFPILLPVSRKSVIGRVLGIENPADRDAGTIACIVAGILRGASILRVHNIPAAWSAIRAVEAAG